MKVINASYEILTPINGDEILCMIERYGRVCYKSESRITDASAERFVRNLIARGHESVLEHVSFSVKFICDRGVSHELVRHRLASFSQESTRYCDYSDDKFGGELTFIKPCLPCKSTMDNEHAWYSIMSEIESVYFDMLQNGCTPEQARCVLPNSLKTEIVMTANLREWRHFLKLRTSPAAHPQIREVVIPLLNELKSLIPVIFDDIGVKREDAADAVLDVCHNTPDIERSGWVSVKDRLPDDEQEVLVIAHGWDGRLVYVGSHKRVEAQKSWLTGITNKSSEWSLWGWSYLKEPIVTHWLPMPEPPEEGKNNEM